MANQVKTPKVTVIDPIAQEKAKLRVAAYARVSSDSADQLNSYLAQVDYYTRHIGDNPDWELADIYADEGISGLDTQKRDEFNRMMADCRAGKIDRILVKSMSRFARNTRDTLHFMRELMRLGVTIRFEKESIDTGRLSSEQTATIYAAFAQMESTGHSSNMRLSVKMRMEKGIFTPSSMPYGYRLNGLEPEIVPEEAEVVRHIFSSALRGRGQMDIAQELNESGVVRRHGRGRWHHHTISYILTNPPYTGNTIWNKSFRSDTIPFPMVKSQSTPQKIPIPLSSALKISNGCKPSSLLERSSSRAVPSGQIQSTSSGCTAENAEQSAEEKSTAVNRTGFVIDTMLIKIYAASLPSQKPPSPPPLCGSTTSWFSTARSFSSPCWISSGKSGSGSCAPTKSSVTSTRK